MKFTLQELSNKQIHYSVSNQPCKSILLARNPQEITFPYPNKITARNSRYSTKRQQTGKHEEDSAVAQEHQHKTVD